jgi:hypothetical protein
VVELKSFAREGEAAINGSELKRNGARVTAMEASRVGNRSRIEDDFDTWSRERAAQLVQANKSLKKQEPWANASRKVKLN